MDIRKFFTIKGTQKRKRSEPGSSDEEVESAKSSSVKSKPTCDSIELYEKREIGNFGSNAETIAGPSTSVEVEVTDNDIGKWVCKSSSMSTDEKMKILKYRWEPSPGYNFAKDAIHLKRNFQYSWLNKYSPWLVYSKHLKGAFCMYCVLFPPATVQGVQGSFSTRPFTRYKHMHEYCKNHAESRWHQWAVQKAKAFLENVPVDVQMVTGHHTLITENRRILASLISNIIFCGVHDLPLRGKGQHEGIYEDLNRLRIDAGDEDLKKFLLKGKKNVTYTSPQIQNELIDLCGSEVRNFVLRDVKKSYSYSVLADETADISGKEQLSIGLRFFDEEEMMIREEFLGFAELKAMNAKTIADTIDRFLEKAAGLIPEQCVGQGYDGCATMAGKDGGVQKIMREKYKKALYFHCASHRLNLVVNDLNKVPEIRNTISTIKDIIFFFRESVIRRQYIPNIPALCETRWSQKYKSISVFKTNFVSVVRGLERLSEEGNASTRKTAFQLHCSATKPVFIICVSIIAKYSALLEPVADTLQSKNLDLIQCANHIKKILAIVRANREKADDVMNELLVSANAIAAEILANLTPPRTSERQQHRSNPPAVTPSEYWTRSILIPYLDSFMSALQSRFSDDNTPAFSLLYLHPFLMLQLTVEEFKERTKSFIKFYELDGFESEAELWYNTWKEKNLSHQELKDLEIARVIRETSTFFPNTKKALLIALSQPCSTSTIERSFSTLRRVKTWLRSTMTENRLNGLCLMSLHRKIVAEKKEELIKEVIDKFAQNPRKLMF